jgi:hypothetical protein
LLGGVLQRECQAAELDARRQRAYEGGAEPRRFLGLDEQAGRVNSQDLDYFTAPGWMDGGRIPAKGERWIYPSIYSHWSAPGHQDCRQLMRIPVASRFGRGTSTVWQIRVGGESEDFRAPRAEGPERVEGPRAEDDDLSAGRRMEKKVQSLSLSDIPVGDEGAGGPGRDEMSNIEHPKGARMANVEGCNLSHMKGRKSTSHRGLSFRFLTTLQTHASLSPVLAKRRSRWSEQFRSPFPSCENSSQQRVRPKRRRMPLKTTCSHATGVS